MTHVSIMLQLILSHFKINLNETGITLICFRVNHIRLHLSAPSTYNDHPKTTAVLSHQSLLRLCFFHPRNVFSSAFNPFRIGSSLSNSTTSPLSSLLQSQMCICYLQFPFSYLKHANSWQMFNLIKVQHYVPVTGWSVRLGGGSQPC